MVDQTRASFRGAILRCRRKKKSNQRTERAQVDEGNQRESRERPGYYLRGSDFAAKKGRAALRVRGREITSVVCGFSYVQEVTMVYPGAIPLRSAGPNASPSFFLFLFLPFHISLSLEENFKAMEEKQEEDEQEEEVAFVPTSSELDAVCHFFTFPLAYLALSMPFSLFHLLPRPHLSLSPLPRLSLGISSSTADALCLEETRLETLAVQF